MSGRLGRQKTVDIELMLPTTGERAFVQVKWGEASAIFCNKTPLFGGTARARNRGVARTDRPAFAAQGFDNVVGSLVAAAEEFDDLRPRRLALPPFGVTRRRTVCHGAPIHLLSRPKRERCERNQAADPPA